MSVILGGSSSSAGRRGALVKKSAVQSITNGVQTAVTFDQEEYDTDAIHNTGSNTSRLTVPAGVTKVRLQAGVRWASNNAGFRQAQIQKNGAGYAGMPSQTWVASGATNHEVALCSPILVVSPGDYFELIAWQTSGAALNVEAASATWLAMEIIA